MLVAPRHLVVELNGVEFPNWRNIRLASGIDEGATRVTVDFFVDELEVDADVMAVINDLNPANA